MNRIVSLLKSTRLWGLIGTGVVLWFLAFVVFSKLDVSWIMPDTNKMARNLLESWPRMPFFSVDKEPVTTFTADGKVHIEGNVMYYTVPTRQFSQQELAQMGVTNHVSHPASPK